MTRRDRPVRLCQWDHWRLEPVYGEQPGYLVVLLCAEGHVHHVIQQGTLMQARRAIRAWERTMFSARHPGLWIEDVAAGRAILPR